MLDCQVKCVVGVISHFPASSHGFLPGLRECTAPVSLPFAAPLSPLLWGSARGSHSFPLHAFKGHNATNTHSS